MPSSFSKLRVHVSRVVELTVTEVTMERPEFILKVFEKLCTTIVKVVFIVAVAYWFVSLVHR